MPQGHAYLCAVMDWHSRKLLGWAVSNTMDSALTEKALADAVAQCGGLPQIFNTDQGSQFTSPEWTGRLKGLGIAVSMDGKGRWMDNVFIERLWRSLQHEDIYLKGYPTVGELEQSVRPWFEFYNTCASSIASTVRRIVCSPAHAPDRQTPRGAQSLPRHLPSPRRF